MVISNAAVSPLHDSIGLLSENRENMKRAPRSFRRDEGDLIVQG